MIQANDIQEMIQANDHKKEEQIDARMLQYWTKLGLDRFFLAGKLWTEKSFNIRALLKKKKSGGERTRKKNLLLFKFYCVKDRQRVMDGVPWHFDRHILVLMNANEEEQPSSISLYGLLFGSDL